MEQSNITSIGICRSENDWARYRIAQICMFQLRRIMLAHIVVIVYSICVSVYGVGCINQ